MQKSNLFLKIILGWLLFLNISPIHMMVGRAQAAEKKDLTLINTGEGQEANRKILVELFLAKERKADIDKIKQEFEALSITRIRPQFFRLGNPPPNIAIGKNIPAPVARVAMKLAIDYNGGIKYLLPEFRFFPHHIVIGSSAYDESSQIPVTPENVEKLLNPELSTDEFHTLYRHLTGEDVELPKYID